MIGNGSIEELKKLGAGRVLLQIPEGLRTRHSVIVSELEKEGFEVILSVEPCFGACDIRDTEARDLGCDAVLHIGHSDFGIKPKVPVVYDAWKVQFDAVKIFRKNSGMLSGYRSAGLLSTIQYADSLVSLKDALDKSGIKAFIGTTGNLRAGQVLGCDFSNATSIEGKVDCLIFIGSGNFHSEGLLRATSKPVLYLNAESGRLELLRTDQQKAEVKRALRIEKARGMKRFAVFVSVKPGQRNTESALKLKKIISSKGKEAVVISADMLSPDKLMGMGFEVIVNTACPRIYDDQKLFGLVILDPEDVSGL